MQSRMPGGELFRARRVAYCFVSFRDHFEQGAEADVRAFERRVQQGVKKLRIAVDCRRIEQSGSILENDPHSLSPLIDMKNEIQFGVARLQRYLVEPELGDVELRHRNVVKRHFHLENGRITGVALRPQGFDQFVERKRLMIIGRKSDATDALDRLFETRIAIQSDPKSNEIDEKPDHGLRAQLSDGSRHRFR